MVALGFAAVATSASAAVTGELKIGSAGSFTMSLTGVAWTIDPSSSPAGPPWNSEVASTTALTFAGCPSAILGTPGCLDAAPFTVGEGIEIAPVTSSTTVPLSNFLVFAGNGVTHAAVSYTLSAAGPGSSSTNCSGATTVGASCSLVPGSPEILTKSPTGTTVTLTVSGTAADGAGGANPWTGQFTGVIAGQTPAQVQLFFCPSGTCTASDATSGRTISFAVSGDLKATAAAPPP